MRASPSSPGCFGVGADMSRPLRGAPGRGARHVCSGSSKARILVAGPEGLGLSVASASSSSPVVREPSLGRLQPRAACRTGIGPNRGSGSGRRRAVATLINRSGQVRFINVNRHPLVRWSQSSNSTGAGSSGFSTNHRQRSLGGLSRQIQLGREIPGSPPTTVSARCGFIGRPPLPLAPPQACRS